MSTPTGRTSTLIDLTGWATRYGIRVPLTISSTAWREVGSPYPHTNWPGAAALADDILTALVRATAATTPDGLHTPVLRFDVHPDYDTAVSLLMLVTHEPGVGPVGLIGLLTPPVNG